MLIKGMRLNTCFKSVLRDVRSLLGDLLLFNSPRRKGPKSAIRIFAYRYQLARLRAVEITYGLARSSNVNKHPETERQMSCGMFKCQIQISDALKQAISATINLKSPTNAGARQKMSSSWPLVESNFEYRADYWEGTSELRELTITALERAVGSDLLFITLSALAGYKVARSDLYVGVAVTRGENSNSQWHLDSFHPVIKGFIALDDIAEDDAKFQYVLGSFDDRQLIREIHKSWILTKQHIKYSNSPRLSPTHYTPIREQKIYSMIGPAGTSVFANTSGVHRKGPDNSGRERWQIGLEVRRRGPQASLYSYLFSRVKFVETNIG